MPKPIQLNVADVALAAKRGGASRSQPVLPSNGQGEAEPSEARAQAWETRRERYGAAGHNGYRPRRNSPLERRALRLIVRLHIEAILSEGQCCAALDLDRVTFRKLCEELGERGTTLGERIAFARHDASMTQEDVAARVGLTRAQVANIEAGRSDLTTSRLLRFAAAFGVSAGDLLPAENDASSPSEASAGTPATDEPNKAGA